jgi:hypothetical protein
MIRPKEEVELKRRKEKVKVEEKGVLKKRKAAIDEKKKV